MAPPSLSAYPGNCHCGSFRFELLLEQPLETVFACRCNICVKRGHLWVFPQESQYKITRGEGILAKYRSESNNIGEHYFCPICGTGVVVKDHATHTGERAIGVNARALLNTNPFALKIQQFEENPESSNSSNSAVSPATFSGPLPDADGEDLKLYTGSCHCGAVTVAVKTKPLPEIEIKEDNCSICQRNANVCIYPNQSQVAILGHENTTEYSFSRKFTGHCFCRICGVQVYMKLHGPPKAVVDNLPPARQEMIRQKLAIVPIRVSILDGVGWSDLKIERIDEGTGGYVID